MINPQIKPFETIELKNRQIIDIAAHPMYPESRVIGVALDNDEAQRFIEKKMRVHGDSEGPYLAVKLPRGRRLYVVDLIDADVTITADLYRWKLRDENGVVSYLTHII